MGSSVKSLRLQDEVVEMFETVCGECGYEQKLIMESLMWRFIGSTAEDRQATTRAWALSKTNKEGIWRDFEATNVHIRRLTQDRREIQAHEIVEKPMGTTRKGGSRGKAD